ncbi:MAG: dihydroorotase [Dehalococcoidales bacterium]|nr:dihydroorotase [Dehalococcoidales bacterium]
MKPLVIHGGHVIDPTQGIDETGDIIISEGKISPRDRESDLSPTNYRVINAAGLIVCPGFIDLHCHLRQPGDEDKETIATGSQSAAKGGYTTICCMPNTTPPLDNPDTIDYVKSIAAREAVIRVLPIGCISKGRQGKELVDMDKLAQSGVIGYSDDGSPVLNSRLMRQALDYSRRQGLPIIDHAEDITLTGDGVMNEGDLSARLGLPGIPTASEEVMIYRDLALAELTGGWLHIAHVATRGGVELIRQAKANGIRVTAEVTPHHLTLTEVRVTLSNPNAKVKPPLRTQRDIQALISGLKQGVIDIIATDHAPHSKADKKVDFAQAPFGISGFETALGSLMSLVHRGELPLTTLISKLTSEPSKIIGTRYGKLGSLNVGEPADITIFDPDMEWVVDASKFVSKGKNTPLDGDRLKGKVMVTISQGKIVYQDDSIKVKGI